MPCLPPWALTLCVAPLLLLPAVALLPQWACTFYPELSFKLLNFLTIVLSNNYKSDLSTVWHELAHFNTVFNYLLPHQC